MKISILFPVFNTAPWLRDCLESILAQTEPAWELLAVNDFSTDESPAILQEFARSDPRIRLFQNDQKGIVPALRMAFQNAAGDLVANMDSDDRMAPRKLEVLKELLLARGSGHVATGCVEYFSDSGALGEGFRRYAEWLNGLSRDGRHFEEIYKECPVPSPCWMAWRSDLLRCGAFTADTIPEDYDLCFRWRQAGFKITAGSEVLHHWRDRPGRNSLTDPRYRDNSFLELKTGWFLRLDRDPQRPLALWGAGKKGKRLARLLGERDVAFHWVCDNEEKWGRQIAGAAMERPGILKNLENPQVIVAVAAPEGQREIRQFLGELGLEAGANSFFFC